jgi:hypothetical protein
MIDPAVIEAFNNRPRVNVSTIKSLTPAERDRVVVHGSGAENLLKNKDFAQFVHQFKFELADELSAIKGHTEEDNNKRIAVANQLVGIEGFVASLQRAVYMKSRAVTPEEPAH